MGCRCGVEWVGVVFWCGWSGWCGGGGRGSAVLAFWPKQPASPPKEQSNCHYNIATHVATIDEGRISPQTKHFLSSICCDDPGGEARQISDTEVAATANFPPPNLFPCYRREGGKHASEPVKNCTAKNHNEQAQINRICNLMSTSNSHLYFLYSFEIDDCKNKTINQNYTCTHLSYTEMLVAGEMV